MAHLNKRHYNRSGFIRSGHSQVAVRASQKATNQSFVCFSVTVMLNQ